MWRRDRSGGCCAGEQVAGDDGYISVPYRRTSEEEGTCRWPAETSCPHLRDEITEVLKVKTPENSISVLVPFCFRSGERLLDGRRRETSLVKETSVTGSTQVSPDLPEGRASSARSKTTFWMHFLNMKTHVKHGSSVRWI